MQTNSGIVSGLRYEVEFVERGEASGVGGMRCRGGMPRQAYTNKV